MTDTPPPEGIGQFPKPTPKKQKRRKPAATVEAVRKVDGVLIVPSRPDFVPNTKHRKEIDNWNGKSGPPALRFSAETRALVRDLALWGIPHNNIRMHVKNPKTGQPLSRDTLEKYFAAELLDGATDGDRRTMKSMMAMIEGRPAVYMKDDDGKIMFDQRGSPIVLQQEIKPNPAPAIWMSKVRPGIGLSEKVVIEHQSSQMKHLAEQLEPLDENDLLQLKSILAKKVDQQRVVDRAARLEGPGRDAETSGEDS